MKATALNSPMLAGLRAAVRQRYARLEAVPQRERLALAGALVALCFGVDQMLAMPARAKRLNIEHALQASADELEQARLARLAERQARDDSLTLRQRKVATELTQVGAKAAPRESLRFLLNSTLQGLPVTVTLLRALPGEEVTITSADTPEPAAAAAAAPAVAATASAPADASAPANNRVLYRHRYELQLQAELAPLLRAVEMLENEVRPLRLERVQLRSTAQGELQANVTLITLGVERSWLSL